MFKWRNAINFKDALEVYMNIAPIIYFFKFFPFARILKNLNLHLLDTVSKLHMIVELNDYR